MPRCTSTARSSRLALSVKLIRAYDIAMVFIALAESMRRCDMGLLFLTSIGTSGITSAL